MTKTDKTDTQLFQQLYTTLRTSRAQSLPTAYIFGDEWVKENGQYVLDQLLELGWNFTLSRWYVDGDLTLSSFKRSIAPQVTILTGRKGDPVAHHDIHRRHLPQTRFLIANL